MIVNYKFNSSGDRFEDRFVIFIGIPVCVLLGILNVFGSMGIIWYEKYGSDLKRIFLNKIVASLNWISIAWFLLVQPSDILLYIYKPLPHLYCNFNFILRNTLIMLYMFYLDISLLVRYVFIFWMKNPENFKDDFWAVFLNICVCFCSYGFVKGPP